MNGGLIWITGLPGAGKSALARVVAQSLRARAVATVVLDGDAMRTMLDLQGSAYAADARLALGLHYARLSAWLAAEGVVVVAAVVALRHAIQHANRQATTPYLEVLLRAPESVRSQRAGDRGGDVGPRVGIELTPEFPLAPDLVLDNDDAPATLERLAATILLAWNARRAV